METLTPTQIYSKKHYQKNKEKIKANVYEYRQDNLEKIRLAQRKYRQEHKKEILEKRRAYYSKPENKEKRKKWTSKHAATHREAYRLRAAKSYKKNSLRWNCEDRDTRRTNKLRAIDFLGGKCSRCNTIFEEISVYDFHHVSGTKETLLTRLWKKPWNIILKELVKCELLCSNCHRIKHNEEKF